MSNQRHHKEPVVRDDDRQLFVPSESEYDAFLRALDEPPTPNTKLKQLMITKAPWES